MQKRRIFISSVQSEFAEERAMLFDYIQTDALFGQIFEPFIFEKTEAKSESASNIYLMQVERCDIYIGLLGEKYGNEDENGISPTEKEYDLASKLNKTRLVYLKKTAEREKKEKNFIRKVEQQVVRKSFEDFPELKTEVYASLIRYLEEEEIIRIFPFDATINRKATLEDIDIEKIKKFIRRAKFKRNFPFDESDYLDVLLHLNLMENGRLTNAALLLFAKQPQKFVISSSVKCCQYYGNETVRPIPSLHIYEGDLFELIDQTVSFVMSRIDAEVSGRDRNVLAEIKHELPLLAVTEAIVNAVCHRDYTSNGSVQVTLYKNRLEIWNPGQLPYGLTPEILKGKHKSLPSNPLIARALYLYGAIEQVGTGTEMLVKQCLELGLPSPDFECNNDFNIVFWRNEEAEGGQKTETGGQKGGQKTETGGQKGGQKTETGGQKGGQKTEIGGQILSEIQQKIIELMLKNSKISRNELSNILNINASAIQKHINKLKKAGIIQREGADRGGYWKMNELNKK